MEDNNPTSALDTRIGVAREPIGRPEVLRDMVGRRRIWTLEQKLAIVADGDHAPMFVPVVADSPKPKSNDVAIEVELGGAVVRIGRAASPGLAAAVIQALQVQR